MKTPPLKYGVFVDTRYHPVDDAKTALLRGAAGHTNNVFFSLAEFPGDDRFVRIGTAEIVVTLEPQYPLKSEQP